jgi:hypothetical protein
MRQRTFVSARFPVLRAPPQIEEEEAMSSRIHGLSFVAALVAAAVPALAQTTPTEATPTATPTAAPTRPPFVAGYKNGFTLQSETGDFALKLSGYAQADGRFLCRR